MSKNGVPPITWLKAKHGSQKKFRFIVYSLQKPQGDPPTTRRAGNGGHGQARTADLTIISRAL